MGNLNAQGFPLCAYDLWDARVSNVVPQDGLDGHETLDNAVDMPHREGEHQGHVKPSPVADVYSGDKDLQVWWGSGVPAASKGLPI